MNDRLNLPTYELHPLCVLFPRMVGAEFDALREDIRANGLRTPIVLHDGMILDGGNRYRACIEAGVEPEFVEFAGGNLASFVLSANLHRRHMSAGQQAAIVASAQDWAQAQTVGNPAFKAQSGNVAALQTVGQRAAESGASERTQRMADKVAKADPGLALKVAHGEVSLPKAHAQVSKPSKAELAADTHGCGPVCLRLPVILCRASNLGKGNDWQSDVQGTEGALQQPADGGRQAGMAGDAAGRLALLHGRTKEPRVFFHGTRDGFTVFDPRHASKMGHGWPGVGHYVTSDYLATMSRQALAVAACA